MKLAAIKDALDRSGIQAKTAVSVAVSTKPFEIVFDSIIAGPRDPENEDALAIESESAARESETEDDEIIGEIDDDVIEDDLLLPSQQESESVVDVEVVVDEGYTDEMDADRPGTTTPPDPSSGLSVELSPGPLGPYGPAGSGLLSLSDAVAAQAEMNARAAARVRDMRRR